MLGCGVNPSMRRNQGCASAWSTVMRVVLSRSAGAQEAVLQCQWCCDDKTVRSRGQCAPEAILLTVKWPTYLEGAGDMAGVAFL